MGKKRPDNGRANGNAAKLSEATAAYFLSLTVRNVRCFGDEQQTLNLADKDEQPAQWTVLLGNNGTGKTTILQALAAFETIQNSEERTGEPRFHYLPYFENSFRRSVRTDARLAAGIATGDPLSAPHRLDNRLNTQLEINRDESTEWGPTTEESRKALVCYGYGASRRFSLKGLPESARDDATATLFSDDANLRNVEDWLLQLDYSAKANESSAVRSQQKWRRDLVTELLIKILHEVKAIRFVPGEGTHPSPRVEANTPYGWVAFRQLGHGYRTLIAWVVDFVSRLVERYPDMPNPLAAPAVVLVDELDLHMHPEWQRKVMCVLTECFPNTQFVVTAHSPLIVQAAAEDANIAVLRREGDHVVIDNDMGHIRGWDVNLLLTSDLFGLPSARPPQYDAIFERRETLLKKSKLTAKERQELASLNEQVYQLPFGETAQQAKMIETLHQTLEVLKKHEQKAQ
jgi:hypothetical protein